MSCGGSFAVLGRSFWGLNRLRGVIATRPETFSLMARKSRKLSPGETARTVWSSLRSTASCASTMMLLTPSWSMKLIISFCAPAVIESMATTAPTPKIMPSMVSKLRSLCAKRLASPIFSSGMMCEPIMLFRPRGRQTGRRAAARLLLSGLALLVRLVGGGVGQRHHFTRLHAAGEYHQRFALFHQLHFARLKAAVLLLHVNGVLAVAREDSLRRQVKGVRNLLDDDFDIGQQAGTKQRLHLRILLGR